MKKKRNITDRNKNNLHKQLKICDIKINQNKELQLFGSGYKEWT